MTARDSGMIFRDGIMSLFDRISNERIIYVCAPAGFGKTVSVRQWLDSNSRKIAPIALDEYDNNPERFCERFCSALTASQPRNSALAELASHPSFSSAPAEFTLKAIDCLKVRNRTVFVIDDLHFITNGRVLRLLLLFLKRLPDSFQIVLISRNELPYGFSELRVRGNLAQITAEQLRFSSEEIMRLFEKRGKPVSSAQAKDILRHTGGWAIGINALLLSEESPTGDILNYLEEFIRSSIWEKWDGDIREFMLKTAAAKELNPSLCAELTGFADSEKILKGLMRSGAFISQTSDGIYHYHHLFHSFLKSMLEERGDEFLFPLLEKEGQWLLSQQDFFGAADCFVRCGSIDGLANSIAMLSVVNRGNFAIEKMLSFVQTPMYYKAAEKYPHLFGQLVWACFATGRLKDMENCADKFYARFPEILEKSPEYARVIILLYFVDYRITLRDLVQNAASLSISNESQVAQGSISMNMPLLHRCARDFSELAREDVQQSVSTMKKLIGWVFGDEADLLSECLQAGLLYEQGLMEKAYLHALAAKAEIKEQFTPELKFCTLSVLIHILDALGRTDEAAQAITHMETMIEYDKAYYLNRNVHALIARRKFQTGDMNAASDWLSKRATTLHDASNFYRIYEAFTTCRAHIVCGSYDSAIILLKKIIEFAETAGRNLDKIEAYVLLSIAFWKKARGFQAEAIQSLEKAVESAYAYGYTQMFINEGAEVSGMMQRLQKRAEQRGGESATPSSFIKKLYLNASEHYGGGLTSGQSAPAVKFTEKQTAVIKLLCEGKSYREITEIIGITRPTLRSHIALIYKKLGVTNEKDAVLKVRSLGILE